MMDKRATWPVRGLELRREGKRPAIAGRFACGDLATIADRGQLRKEHIMAKAFSFAPDRQDDREINLPFGHDFDKPSASRRNGSLILDDPDDAPTFFATIADELMDVTHVREASAMLGAGLVTGISPGFRVPLKRTVPNAERLDPEPGTPGVFIRTLLARVLYELSLVTRPAYAASQAELRALKTAAHPVRQDRIWLP